MPSPRPLRIGTRGSQLARWQAEQVRDALTQGGREATLIEISTSGDIRLNVSLGRGAPPDLFTRELDEAVGEGRVDLAVHSLKDIPTRIPDGLMIAAVLRRGDPRDALVGRSALRWSDLPHGAIVATCSVRRRAQLLRARPDLAIAAIRGNVPTRLARLQSEPEWAATILAVAGLERLGLGHRIGERLSETILMPAPGQGAIAVTTRVDDLATSTAVREAMQDDLTAQCVAAERAFLGRLEGGCQVPVGALARRVDGKLLLQGRIVALDGSRAVEDTGVYQDSPDLEVATASGIALAERMLAAGGADILDPIRSSIG